MKQKKLCRIRMAGAARTACERAPGHPGAHRARIQNGSSRRGWKTKGWN